MPNLTLSIPEDLLKNGRSYAQSRGTSLNALVRELLTEKVSKPAETVDSIIARLRQSPGNSKSIRINREELHRH
ncbi:MAG: DUF6364 family protein [Luteolibacter sp.]|jgi:hypothetical protein